MRSNEEKYQTVLEKNTFYFFNPTFEERYEGELNALSQTLMLLKNEIDNQGLKKELFENFLAEKHIALKALLTLTGFSNESLKRLITLSRIVDNPELDRLLYKKHWLTDSSTDIKEWSDPKIAKLIRENAYFRKGIVNLFFEGSTVPFLVELLPLFELKKLNLAKLSFETPALVDTIVRYKEKGSYSGKADNNPELVIKELLRSMDIRFESGDLTDLFQHENTEKRTMDFIIPNKQDPKIIIECSFVVTTSSGQGDKSKTEINIQKLITRYYPQTKFIGFVDGIGWYARQKDLKRMVNAYDDVFTFHSDELNRFRNYILSNV
jgi:hypothetical protein